MNRCGICNGSGEVQYRTIGDALPTDLGNGVTIQSRGGTSTRACSCVRDLPATDGTATWWDSETLYTQIVMAPIFNECFEVAATGEVPRNEHGRRVHRTRENAHWPSLIHLDAPASSTLHPVDARKLAAALSEAADACDRADALATGGPG